jgi:ATP-dependent helicase HrpB
MRKLPIDQILPLIIETLQNSRSVVIHAPPGAGKTTRIPLYLLKSANLHSRKIVMLEPRRLAAVSAARWMAASIGEDVGETIGYTIRFERKVSAATRIEVVTEGVLTRRLQSDPFLEEAAVVIFDEFHERSLHADLALALCSDVQKGGRADLKIVVMSATLQCGPIAELLGNAPVISVEGKSYPVGVRYLDRIMHGDIAAAACGAVQGALQETDGDLLVFLPGSGEIRRCQRMLEAADLTPPILITPLYGDLPFAAQEEAIMPAGRRKVVLATNIAETSITIEGVRVVIDAGYSRQLRFDPANGLNRLVTARVSAASAAQRCGRAGRLAPGTCYRLWSKHTQSTLLPFTPPEILRTELSPLVLELAEWGITDTSLLDWLNPPPAGAMAEGVKLLQRLGALDRLGLITPHGKRMAALPLHPRLAHMLLVAHERGQGALAADIAALLSERDILRWNDRAAGPQASPSDILDRVEALNQWRNSGGGLDALGEVDPWHCRIVNRAARELCGALAIKGRGKDPSAGDVGIFLALAFPERIARQREPGSDRYLLANGRGGRLSKRSAVRDQPFLVAVVMEGGERGEGHIHQASALTQEVLRREFGNGFVWRRSVEWDKGEGRVVAREEERLGEVVISSRQVVPDDGERRCALLEGLRSAGIETMKWTPQAVQFRARVEFMAHLFPEEGWPDFSDRGLLEGAERWLAPFLGKAGCLADLGALDILPPLRAMLTWEQARRLDEGAPTHLTVPSGSRIVISYSGDGPPVLAVKLQEMFGLAETPTVAWGRSPLLLHLLSPAGRPIQITADLRNFWNNVYPEVKKELKGRYPKHPWPDDPWSAAPTRHTKRRMKDEG